MLELNLVDIRHLFNSMDPAPFRERELDAQAAAYIVDWAREARAGRTLRLRLHLQDRATGADDIAVAGDAVHEYFLRRAAGQRRQLRQLFRVGRISLLIGAVFLGVAIAAGDFLAGMVSKSSYADLLRESFVIGGWVALWRPLEIFLYDWWPIHAEAKLFDRLGQMQVEVQ